MQKRAGRIVRRLKSGAVASTLGQQPPGRSLRESVVSDDEWNWNVRLTKCSLGWVVVSGGRTTRRIRQRRVGWVHTCLDLRHDGSQCKSQSGHRHSDDRDRAVRVPASPAVSGYSLTSTKTLERSTFNLVASDQLRSDLFDSADSTGGMAQYAGSSPTTMHGPLLHLVAHFADDDFGFHSSRSGRRNAGPQRRTAPVPEIAGADLVSRSVGSPRWSHRTWRVTPSCTRARTSRGARRRCKDTH
jgi:hypothetical protein